MNTIYKFILILLLSTCFLTSKGQNQTQLIEHLNSKLNQKEYFSLRRLYNANANRLSSNHALYYSAYIDAAFNNQEESNKKILEILKLPPTTVSRTLLGEMLTLKLQNHIHLSQYKEAWQTSMFVRTTYKSEIDSFSLLQLENSEKIWLSLLNEAKQKVHKESDSEIPITVDEVGLMQIPVCINNNDTHFIFDTGAAFSFVQRSVALELGFEIKELGVEILSITGNEVKADIAIANTLKIGNALFENVVFMVLDDTDLNFREKNYNAKGIIGYPVIRDLEEIHVYPKDKIFIPKKQQSFNAYNFALNGLSPTIEVWENNTSMSFQFDTGANLSHLSHNYYLANKSSIDKKYKLSAFNASGAGGAKNVEAFNIKKIKLQAGNGSVKLKNIPLIMEKNRLTDSLYGNLGQDFIGSFNKYVINFKGSTIMFF